MSKTERGFNIWNKITNDRMEKIWFQESSMVGLNTWLRIMSVDDLNHGVAVSRGMASNDTLKYKDDIMIHLSIENLVELQKSIAEVIEYHIKERSKWYEDD